MMKKLKKREYEEVRAWMHRNAREITLSLWKYHEEKGNMEDVLSALSHYQNEDGGFGNVLEPDSWNPASTPYTTLTAIQTLGDIRLQDAGHPIVTGILRYLESGKDCAEDGWAFCVPDNDRYARAPWWTYDEQMSALHGFGVTAALSGFLLRFAGKGTPLFETALGFAGRCFPRVLQASSPDDLGEMGIGGCFALADAMQAAQVPMPCDPAAVFARLSEFANRKIERDPEKWAGYTARPSQFIYAPQSPLYQGNEELVEKEIAYTLETRNPGGVWDITWTWMDNTEKYAKEFALSENWWKAAVALEKIRFLKSFGAVE